MWVLEGSGRRGVVGVLVALGAAVQGDGRRRSTGEARRVPRGLHRATASGSARATGVRVPRRYVLVARDGSDERGRRPPPAARPGRHGQPAGQRDAGRRAPARVPRGQRRRAASCTRRCRSGRTSSRASPDAAAGRGSCSCPTRTPSSPIPAEWSVDPWSGEVRDGHVWGRGALDMKGQVAASAVAIASLAREGFEPAGDLIFVAAADEEVGEGEQFGMPWLVEAHPRGGRGRVLGERGRRRPDRDRRERPSTSARRRRRCRRRSRSPSAAGAATARCRGSRTTRS